MAAGDPAQLLQLKDVFKTVIGVAIPLAGVAIVIMFLVGVLDF